MAIALVANTYSTGAASSAIDTTGATLLVAVCSGFIGSTPNLTDSKSNTWTGLTIRGGGSLVKIYYVANPTVGTNHTFDPSGTNPSCTVAAFSGVVTTSPFDQENGNTGSGGSVSTGSVTPSEDNELVIAGVTFYPAGVVSINGGFTITDQVNYVLGAEMGSGLAYLIQTSVAAANPAWSHSGFTDAAVAIATFKAAAATGNRRRRLIIAGAA